VPNARACVRWLQHNWLYRKHRAGFHRIDIAARTLLLSHRGFQKKPEAEFEWVNCGIDSG